MKLNAMPLNKGARTAPTRPGRGIGSGKGKTAGRGQKGYKARAGASIGGFEGGQTPIHMRLPKRGFRNTRFQKPGVVVNLCRLQEALDGGRIKPGERLTAERLVEAGLVRHAHVPVRILAKGALKAAITIEAQGASKAAEAAIKATGGEIVITPVPLRKSRAPQADDTSDNKADNKADNKLEATT